MMLLPSGRSNSDVYPLQNANAPTATMTTSNVGVAKPLLLTRTSSPQLTTLPTSNGNANAYTSTLYSSNSVSAPVSTSASASFATSTVAAAQETTGNLSETGTHAAVAAVAAAATQAATSAAATTTTSTGETVNSGGIGFYGPILGQGSIAIGNWVEIDRHLESVQEKLKAGWTVHAGKEGRLYYCK